MGPSCLHWESASNKHLTGLSAKTPTVSLKIPLNFGRCHREKHRDRKRIQEYRLMLSAPRSQRYNCEGECEFWRAPKIR